MQVGLLRKMSLIVRRHLLEHVPCRPLLLEHLVQVGVSLAQLLFTLVLELVTLLFEFEVALLFFDFSH